MTDQELMATSRRAGRSVVNLVPNADQTPEEIEEDFAASFDLLDHLRSEGVDEWTAGYRTYGRLRVARTKEVGPPPWRLPKVYAAVRRGPLTLAVGVGWRSTAYEFFVMWARASGPGETPPSPKHCGSSEP